MNPHISEPPWQISWLKPSFPWEKGAIRPADVAGRLVVIMLARENLLEDANYDKVVPNQYVIELSEENYLRNFQPLRDSLIHQWRDKLVEHLLITNNRLGRKEYRFAGPVQVDLRAGSNVKEYQARILTRVHQDLAPRDPGVRPEAAQDPDTGDIYLESIGENLRWYIYPGENTIGRDNNCDIVLALPQIQEKRLVSSVHATVRRTGSRCVLCDGSPAGKPSTNGTYVNNQRISSQGVPLKDGDTIILAALRPDDPQIDTPGAAAFRFRMVKRMSEDS